MMLTRSLLNQIRPQRRAFQTLSNASLALRGSVSVTTCRMIRSLSSASSATESSVGEVKNYEFRAETKKLLGIVANSLYSEREVFLRELVSNASDALEKLRHHQVTVEAASTSSTADNLQITIFTNSADNTLTIQDNGIGMTLEELNENLGTIAKSGSQAFLEQLGKASPSTSREKIIGQFGVGFYSAFMVADKITVFTRSSSNTDAPGYCWTSDGLGSYQISDAQGVAPGTKIVMHLKKDARDFSQKATIENLIKKHSNFIGFPIAVDGATVNTIPALWAQVPSSVREEQYTEFYKFISENKWDEPRFRLHYRTDAPIQLSALLYVPGWNEEMAKLERIESRVGLYSRKVLIQPKAKTILPDWLRFLKGAVDSEDIPLNLSRELLQDGLLVAKIRRVLTSRIVKWLSDEAKKDAEAFEKFFQDFGIFIKEGVCTDADNKESIAKLLRFESSAVNNNDDDHAHLTSLVEYVKRSEARKDVPKKIFYLLAPNRSAAEQSPYLEAFKERDYEVLYLYDPRDEYVIQALRNWDGMDFVGIDSKDAVTYLEETEKVKSDASDRKDGILNGEALASDELETLSDRLRETLGTRVKEIRVAPHLASHPAVVIGHDSPAHRGLMRALAGSSGMPEMPIAPVRLDINPKHPVIRGLFRAYQDRPVLAGLVATQLLDNALVAAGAMEDARSMVGRINELLEHALEAKTLTKETRSNEA